MCVCVCVSVRERHLGEEHSFQAMGKASANVLRQEAARYVCGAECKVEE